MARKWRREGKSISAVVLPNLRAAAQYATDKATTDAKNFTREAITAAGLGRLGGAVGSTSSLKEGQSKGDAWGVLYARGSTESRANQTLLAYSEGAEILPTGGRKWLAFPTDAIPKRVGRQKMTPKLYRSSGLVASIGKLVFVPSKTGRVAYLVARDVTVSRRTGRAKAFAGRVPRGADRKRGVVAFVLIRYTKRAQRFNQRTIMQRAVALIPRYAEDYQGRTAG